MHRDNGQLEPAQLELLIKLVSANDNVSSEERTVIRGLAMDGAVHYFHPGFPGGSLIPNEYDLQVLQNRGFLSVHDQGGRKGWRIDVLPAGESFLRKPPSAQDQRLVAPTSLNPKGVHSTTPLTPSPPTERAKDPKSAAVEILNEIISKVNVEHPDLKPILRLCLYAERLLKPFVVDSRFSKELNGYGSQDKTPAYRHLLGYVVWKTFGVHKLRDPEDYTARIANDIYPTIHVNVDARLSLQLIIDGAVQGAWDRSEEHQSKELPALFGQGSTLVEPYDYYPSDVFKACLSGIEQMIYEWAVEELVLARYETQIENLWQGFRESVDETLQDLHLTSHFSSLNQDLASSNPADWRKALLGCRNILRDVANHLWRDPRDTYPLAGPKGKPVQIGVKESEYVNRLQAYLHQKSVHNDHGKLLESEAELLGSMLNRVNRVGSHGHAESSRELAESAVLHTYVLLAELIRWTDMRPIEKYDE